MLEVIDTPTSAGQGGVSNRAPAIGVLLAAAPPAEPARPGRRRAGLVAAPQLHRDGTGAAEQAPTTGFDDAVVDDAGRIRAVHGFLGRVPAA